jgi:predicted nucleic acid-binding protein
VGLISLDSSVAIAFLAAYDAHHEAAREVLGGVELDDLCVSTVAYAKVMVGAYRVGGSFQREAERLFQRTGVEPVTQAIASRAAHLRVEHPRLKLPDALIIATGEELRASRILTADSSWQGVSRRVEVLGA